MGKYAFPTNPGSLTGSSSSLEKERGAVVVHEKNWNQMDNNHAADYSEFELTKKSL